MITEMKNLLTCLNSVGIETVVLENDNDNAKVRGVDPSGSIVVFDTVDIDAFSEYPMAIQSVNALLSRLNLFSNDSKLKLGNDGECVTDITITEKRKKVTYRCSDPNNPGLPSKSIDDLSIRDDNSITMTSSQVEELVKAIQSISQTGTKENQTISFSVTDHSASVSVFDGESDSYNDVVENVGMEKCDKVSWDVKSFNKVMRRSADGRDTLVFGISKYGTATFNIGDMVDVVVVPFS